MENQEKTSPLGKMRWYVIDVYSGSEKRVAQIIQEKVLKKSFEDYVGAVLVPSEMVTEVRKGVKVSSEKTFFPGYVLVQMILTDEVLGLIRSVPRVSRLLGGKTRPLPISEKEVSRLMGQIEASVSKPRSSLVFELGEEVKVVEGPFATFSGVVEDVDLEKERLKVSVMIFGRSTIVELEFLHVDKIR
jgi:transcription termination/antitermination protein NusG